jgi:hypothetical protein
MMATKQILTTHNVNVRLLIVLLCGLGMMRCRSMCSLEPGPSDHFATIAAGASCLLPELLCPYVSLDEYGGIGFIMESSYDDILVSFGLRHTHRTSL